MKNTRAVAWIPVMLIIVLLGGGGYFVTKKGIFNKDMQRAKQEVQTTGQLVGAANGNASKASSVLTAIGEANAGAPDSKQKEFIGQAVPIGLNLLGSPDPQFLATMRELENATLKGKVQEQGALIAELQAESKEDRTKYLQAVTAKERADQRVLVAAKNEAEANADKLLAFYAAVACIVLYGYVKVTHFSPGQISTFVHDIRNETQSELNPVIQKLDSAASPLQQKIVKFLQRFK